MSLPFASLPILRGRDLVKTTPPPTGGLLDWTRVAGRLVEVSEPRAWGALSVLCDLFVQVQARQETIAWISSGKTIFYPPDLAFRGVDLAALVVVRVPHPQGGWKAADWLVRSGAFGVVVVDAPGDVDESPLGRLSRLAEENLTAVILLTQKKPSDPSMGTQVSLRGGVSRLSSGEIEWQIFRDKRSGPLTRHREKFHGPSGLY